MPTASRRGVTLNIDTSGYSGEVAAYLPIDVSGASKRNALITVRHQHHASLMRRGFGASCRARASMMHGGV